MAQRRSAERNQDRQDFRNNITNAQVLTWDIGGDDLANAHDNFTKRNLRRHR